MSNFTYSVITPIKESNKGKVYLAKLEGYDFPVIVKELKHGNQAVFQALSELDSEYVPKIYKIEASADGLVVAEEYIEGETLAEHLAASKLTAVEWIGIAKQLCEALSTLHAHVPPLIHRDIKPSNIIINSKGRVKLIDFDSSRLYKVEAEEDTRLLGTERYAPPEQYGFSQTDCRSDIYSMGVVFNLFSEFMEKNEQRSWKQLVEKCTSFSPDSRYQSVDEVAREIKRIDKAGLANRWKIVAGICVGVMVAALGIGVWTDRLSKPVGPMQNPSAESNQWNDSQNDMLNEISKDKENDKANDDVNANSGPESENQVEGKVPLAESSDNQEKLQEPPAESSEDQAEVQEPVAEQDEKNITVMEEPFRTTAPEWRDIETDAPATIAIKEEIRSHSFMVWYCFKDRLDARGFLLHDKVLDGEGSGVEWIKLYYVEEGRQFYISEEHYAVSGQTVIIDKDYMLSLGEGYYEVTKAVRQVSGGVIDVSEFLYVAQSDILQEPSSWLQNSTLSYHGTEGALQVVVRNDSAKTITGVCGRYGEVIDSSMYTILHEGKVLEFSKEFLEQARGRDVHLSVVGNDGSSVYVRIDNYSNLDE